MRKVSLLTTVAATAMMVGIGGYAPSAEANYYTVLTPNQHVSTTISDGGSNSLSFNQFDSNLGPLDAVIVTLSVSGHASGVGTWTTGGTGSVTAPFVFDVAASAAITKSGGPSTLPGLGALGLTGSFTLAPTSSDPVSGPVSGSWTAIGSASSSPTIDPASFAEWQSPGGSAETINFSSNTSIGTIADYVDSFMGAIGTISSEQYLVSLDVQYEYTPEPASMFVLGGGLVGLGLVRRRWKHRGRRGEPVQGDAYADSDTEPVS
jgi:PEP-CTERM motif